jgi:acyl carrier protein
MSVDARLRGVLSSVLGVDAAAIKDTDSTKTMPEWDSVAHLELMLALEAEFAVQLSADEIAGLTTVSAIRDRLSGASA